jgi:hypothetical protein
MNENECIEEYREKNLNKMREYSKKHYQKNKEKLKEKHRKYREDNIDKFNQYYQNNLAKFKEYRRRYKLKKYNLSLDQFNVLLNKQNHQCGICGGSLTDKNCHVDHNHDSGEIRGLLCLNCNLGIGLLKDSPELLNKAAKYLTLKERNP